MKPKQPADAEVTAYLARYKAGRAAVEAAIAGATTVDLDRRADETGAWSARQVIHHLADSETNSYVRLRRLLAEPDGTAIAGYDEAHWAEVLAYDRPIDASLAVFVAVRTASAELLDALLPELRSEIWEKVARHSDSGDYTLLDWLEIYAEHAEVHAAQIERARRGLS